MPKSYRHIRAARLAGQAPAPKLEYRITDPNHRPDLNNEFGGAKVRNVQGNHMVSLTEAQAQFWLDQGAIEVQKSDEDKRLEAERRHNVSRTGAPEAPKRHPVT